jgi:hypothetical protein
MISSQLGRATISSPAPSVVEQRGTSSGRITQLQNSVVRLARVGEGLALAKVDVEEPFAASGRCAHSQLRQASVSAVKNRTANVNLGRRSDGRFQRESELDAELFPCAFFTPFSKSNRFAHRLGCSKAANVRIKPPRAGTPRDRREDQVLNNYLILLVGAGRFELPTPSPPERGSPNHPISCRPINVDIIGFSDHLAPCRTPQSRHSVWIGCG